LYAQVSAAVLGIRADVRRLARSRRNRKRNWISSRRRHDRTAAQRIRGRELGQRPSDRGRRPGGPIGSRGRGRRPVPEVAAGAGQAAAPEHAERRRTELAEEDGSGGGGAGVVGSSGRTGGAGEQLHGRGH